MPEEKVSNRKLTTLVRMDTSLRDAISKLAERESRGIAQQIKVMYEEYIEARSSHQK